MWRLLSIFLSGFLILGLQIEEAFEMEFELNIDTDFEALGTTPSWNGELLCIGCESCAAVLALLLSVLLSMIIAFGGRLAVRAW